MRSNIKRYQFDIKQKKEIISLIKYDNWHCWLAIAENYLIIAFAVFISVKLSWYLFPISLLLVGSRQRALATVLHESAHSAFAKNKTLNYVMGTFLSGYLIIQTMSSYKQSHVSKHHARFGEDEEDPDYQYAIQNDLYSNRSLCELFNKNFIYPMLLTKVPSYMKSLLQDRLGDLKRNDKKEFLAFTAFWVIILALTILTGTFHYFLLFWVLPYLTTFNVIGWYIELSEHYPLMQKDNTLHMTRNRHSHPVEKFLTGMHNENYHLIHHLFPTIPYWNLPKAHEILMRDENYRRLDQDSGGIFLSKDGRPSLFQKLKAMRCGEEKFSFSQP